MTTATKDVSLLTDADLSMEKGLPAMEVDHRLASLAKVHRRVESALCFYLQEVDERHLYLEYGHSSTVAYANERLGFEERKTWSLLRMARRLKVLPKMKKAFQQGKIPWTKAREAVKAATSETDQEWLTKCFELSNRQLEQEVKKTLPPVTKKKLVLVLEGEMVDVWEQTREACQRLAGQSLSDFQVFDLMCAEVLCTYALTPPLDPENDKAGGYARSILERDGHCCTRPGCFCRTGLQGHHLKSRGQGGSDLDENKTLACAACHNALEQKRLKAHGRAPDQITWEGPFGVIEKPLPLGRENRGAEGSGDRARKQAGMVKEEEASYGNRSATAGPLGLAIKDRQEGWEWQGQRSRDHFDDAYYADSDYARGGRIFFCSSHVPFATTPPTCGS